MGTVNAVVPHIDLERVGLRWAQAIADKSPTAIRLLKYALNAVDDGLVGQQVFAGEATRLAYMTPEAQEEPVRVGLFALLAVQSDANRGFGGRARAGFPIPGTPLTTR
jgi:hypothetical protein